MPAFRLSCLAYFSLALPGSTLGLLWPSIRASFHQPVGALGILLVFAVTASVLASAATGRLLARLSTGSVLAIGTMLTALALVVEACTPSLWLFAFGMVLFGFGFGPVDAALNAYGAHHFGARQINWMHASYGIGATAGPLLVTALLSNALTWRWVYGTMGITLAIVAVVFTAVRPAWATPPPAVATSPPSTTSARRPPKAVVLTSLTFTAVETGIESVVGIWGYVFLTDGRGLSHTVAGVAVAAYWAMMFVGRIVLGTVAEHLGPPRVLGGAVVGVSVGAALMAVPGPAVLAVVGLMTVGLAAAPIFPLFTLTTAQRIGAAGTTQTVSLQVAASAVGSAALPAGIGLVIGAFNAKALAPPLLLLSLTMCAVYARLSRSPRIG